MELHLLKMELHLLMFGVCLLAYGTVGTDDLKSSLTFVIDETNSMDPDVLEVIKAVDAIVDTVTNSSATPIEEFVVITFFDDAKLLTKTGAKAALKGNLSDINMSGRDSCPRKSLTGIELALNESKDGSLLYVFTDASAEDFNLTEKVQDLSQKKGIQIVFILTGVCEDSTTSPGYLAYQELAVATNGQVFHLQKDKIGEILKYADNAIESRKNIIASKRSPTGRNSFDVNVDGDTMELVIAVSGETPTVTVTCAGAEVNATDITRLQEIAVVKVAVKPGVYKVDVGSRSESRVVVSGSTAVHFQHGFSTIKPSAITDTTRQPVPREDVDVKSYLSIQLGHGGANVKLQSAQILDMDDTVLLDQPLNLVNKDHFYTTEPFVTPNDMFKIAIKGYDIKKDINVTRYALTPIKSQYNKELPIEKEPEVTIEGASKINADFYKPLKLKCLVSGWPRPDVIWNSTDTKNTNFVFPDRVATIEFPYRYISVLEVPKVTENVTYTCVATNSVGGEVTSNVTVQTVKKNFIEVEVEDTTIEYQKPGQIRCNALAYPPATISWYKGHGPLKATENLNISADGSVISIESMEAELAGNYYCVATNSVDKQVKPLKVKVGGVGPPKIDKTIDHLNAVESQQVDITCNIAATPNATCHWSFKNATTSVALNDTTETIRLDDLKTSQAGTYICKAQNDYGVDYHGIELIVEYAPIISSNSSEDPQRVTAVEGRMVLLNCSANGVPAPNITWTHSQGIALTTTRHSFYTNGSLGFSAVHSDEGIYQCEASNDLGSAITTFELEVIISVALESPGKSYIEQEEGTPLTLPCRADGRPTPNITWLYRISPKADIRPISRFDLVSGDLHFPRIHHGQSGEYICAAENGGGSKNLTYFVTVTARPSILFTMKEFIGVNGDMYLRVPCEATGNPKPEIVWTNTTEGYNLASDTERYLIGDDGSLIIKNISNWSAGQYTCTASNKYGTVSEVFTVVVDEFPSPRFLSIQIEEGKSADIPCSVPHKLTDKLRWFKDGKVVNSTALQNVTIGDAGMYTCRVSAVDRPPLTGSTKVEVGFKPRLVDDDAKDIPYRYGGIAVMNCVVQGKPTPQVSWLHDGIALDFTQSTYQFMMDSETQKGTYTCVVKNQYGYAQQDFVVSGPDAA